MPLELIRSYLKELFRPVRLLRIYRHHLVWQKYKGTNIKIGFDSVIRESDLSENVFIGAGCTILNSAIGRRTYLNYDTHINNAVIGSFTSIGSNVSIGIRTHPIDMVSTHPAFYSNNKAFETFAATNIEEETQRIIIGNDVWIGSQVTILKQVTVGDGAIIGYGAIVTKDVPPYAIFGGIPAKIIKYRFDESIIKFLLEIKWWNLDDQFLKKHHNLFQSPDTFIQFYHSNIEYVESFRN